MRPTPIKMTAVAGLLALVIAMPAAATQNVHIQSEIKIRNHFPAFHGRIHVVERRLRASTLGEAVQAEAQRDKKLLGQTISDVEGKWTVLVDPLKSRRLLRRRPASRGGYGRNDLRLRPRQVQDRGGRLKGASSQTTS